MPSPHEPVFTPYSLPPVLQGQPSAVFRYVGGVFLPLPSVRWTEIVQRQGPFPARATFRYAYGVPAGFAGAPFEAVLPVVKSFTTFDTVFLDDRVVVATIDTLGRLQFLFDGYVQIPEAHISGESYAQAFQAQAVPVRCWDTPLVGSYRLHAGQAVPTDPGAYQYTHLPARVNPDGRPNCTGTISGSGEPYRVPAFADDLPTPDADGNLAPWQRSVYHWDLVSLARYLLYHADAPGLTLPDPWDYENILCDFQADGTRVPILCRDLVVGGTPWPDSLHQAIQPHGFTFTFRLNTSGGVPKHGLTFERVRDGLGAPLKSLYLQPARTSISPAATNTRAFNLAVDASQIVNAYVVEPKCDEVEVGVVLAPAFPIDPADANTPEKWLASNPDPAANRDKYRLFTADECGEGHALLSTRAFQQGAAFQQWDTVWGLQWVIRRRPGYGPCFSTDARGQRLKPQLAIVANWGVRGQPDPPLLFDVRQVNSSKQSPVIVPIKGAWELLHDRLGVRVCCEDPTAWHIGELSTGNPAFGKVPSTINLVQNLLNYDRNNPQNHLFLLLTCVVAADRALDQGLAPRRPNSPTRFSVTRVIDGHDRYSRWAVHRSSAYQQANSNLLGRQVDDPAARFYTRDDSAAAQTYAESLRRSTESPSIAGSVTIGRLTGSYALGDRVSGIYPRMNLNADIPTPQNPGRFPMIVQLTWRNEPEQSTTLQLDDNRGAHL